MTYYRKQYTGFADEKYDSKSEDVQESEGESTNNKKKSREDFLPKNIDELKSAILDEGVFLYI